MCRLHRGCVLVLLIPVLTSAYIFLSLPTAQRLNGALLRVPALFRIALMLRNKHSTAENGEGRHPPPPSPLDALLGQHRQQQDRMRRGEVPLRAVILRCIGKDHCGGLGDRLFGIMTIFMLAAMADRAVFVEHAKPLPQRDYLVPNALDWRIDTVENETVKAVLRRALLESPFHNLHMPRKMCSDLLRFPMDQANPVLVMGSNFRTSCLLKVLLQKRFFPKPDSPGLHFNRSDEKSLRFWASLVSHYILQHLFDFSPLVKNQALSILNDTVLPADFDSRETYECLVCVHVRSGKNTHEGDRHHNIADFGRCANMVEEQIREAKTCPSQLYWVVVSDHPKAPTIVGGNFSEPLSTNSIGPIVHVDDNGLSKKHRSGATRLYVDFFVLSRCKHFVASLSTLGETASMFFGPSVRRYDMEHTGMCSSKPSNIYDWQRDVHLSKAAWLKTLEH